MESIFFSKIKYTCSGNVDFAEALNASAEVRMPESHLALIRSLSPDEFSEIFGNDLVQAPNQRFSLWTTLRN